MHGVSFTEINSQRSLPQSSMVVRSEQNGVCVKPPLPLISAKGRKHSAFATKQNKMHEKQFFTKNSKKKQREGEERIAKTLCCADA